MLLSNALIYGLMIRMLELDIHGTGIVTFMVISGTNIGNMINAVVAAML